MTTISAVTAAGLFLLRRAGSLPAAGSWSPGLEYLLPFYCPFETPS